MYISPTDPVIEALRQEIRETAANLDALAGSLQETLVLLMTTNQKALGALSARLDQLEAAVPGTDNSAVDTVGGDAPNGREL